MLFYRPKPTRRIYVTVLADDYDRLVEMARERKATVAATARRYFACALAAGLYPYEEGRTGLWVELAQEDRAIIEREAKAKNVSAGWIIRRAIMDFYARTLS